MSAAVSDPSRSATSEFRVGRVFDQSFLVYSQNFLTFSLTGLITSAPPLLLLANSGAWSFAADTIPARDFAVSTLMTFVLSLLCQAILVHGAFQYLRGQHVNLSESLRIAFRRSIPVFGLATLVMLGVLGVIIAFAAVMSAGIFYFFAGIGPDASSGLSLLFTLPLLLIAFVLIAMLVVQSCVVIPICMVERFNPWKCLKRSYQLTKGNRWKIFAILFMVLFASQVIDGVLEAVVMESVGRAGWLVVSLIWSTVWVVFFSIVVVVTYAELRRAKEGISVDKIAAVFD
jgi:hypothetical protein